MSTYVLQPIFLMLRDASPDPRQQSLEFHLENQDYFISLATILAFAHETLSKNKRYGSPLAPVALQLLKGAEQDLLVLQEEYWIKPKTIREKLKTSKSK